jgi:hypothetical protein
MTERKHIPAETRLRLFAESAGHCQSPDCLRPLFPIEMGGDRHIAEMAHVIPCGDAGPRQHERPEGSFDTNAFENLILLCPSCHTIIDKDPGGYNRNTLLGWKTNHLAALANKQGIRAYELRSQVRGAIVAAMTENKAVWSEVAPTDGLRFEYDPESEVGAIWTQRVRSVILPNHFRIQAIAVANQHHMTADEQLTFAQYKEHVRGLSERHICGIAGRAIRYPVGMDELFE